MNYYQHHIGDYRSATSHLSLVECAIYRRLLDMYYDTEQPISTDNPWVSRRLRASPEDVENVLKEFFVHTPEGWRHARCDQEIAEYHARIERSRQNGALGGRRKSLKTNDIKPTGNPEVTQNEPRGNPDLTQTLANQEPITNKKKARTRRAVADESAPVALPECIPAEVWERWRAYLRERRKPLARSTEEAQVKKLAALFAQGHSAIDIIESSIANGWIGLFPPKTNAANNATKPNDNLRWAL